MAKTKKEKLPAKNTKVFAILSHAGSEYKGIGDTVKEAIFNIPISYPQIKTKGTITVTQGDKKCERLFYMCHLRLIIANELRKVGIAHQFEQLLK